MNACSDTHLPAVATLLEPHALGFAIGGALLLCWPMLVLDGPLIFFDTEGYLWQGHAIFERLAALLTDRDGVGLEVGKLREEAASAGSTRALAYAAFVYLTSRPFGLVGTAVFQTTLVLLMVWPLVRALVRSSLNPWVLLGIPTLVLFTSLPFVASFVMPDLLAAVPVLYALLLVDGWDELTVSSKVILALITGFAILTHYGNIPLAAICVAVALMARFATSRHDLASMGFAITPVIVVVAMNTSLSMIAFGQASVTPQRLPVMLARSIQDGPARWHLNEYCSTEHYAICKIQASVAPTVGKILWSPHGIKHAPQQVQAKIRDEELLILQRAFADYPLQQLFSFSRNVFLQLGRTGTSDLQLYDPSALVDGGSARPLELDRGRRFLDAVGLVNQLTYVGGALAILACFIGESRIRSRRALGFVTVLGVGLLANAAIFGGLSAPVDRYQARVAWLTPLVALLLWHRRSCSRNSAISGT